MRGHEFSCKYFIFSEYYVHSCCVDFQFYILCKALWLVLSSICISEEKILVCRLRRPSLHQEEVPEEKVTQGNGPKHKEGYKHNCCSTTDDR